MLITSLVVMALMLSIGFATYATVDVQTGESRAERHRESVFNLGEAALQEQGYVLGNNWPGKVGNAYPASCSPSSFTAEKCPSPGSLLGEAGNFNAPDYKAGVTWETRVRDNASGTDFYDSSVQDAARWDANGDGKLWVRAQATKTAATTVGLQKRRTIVALLKRETLNESLPPALIRVNKFRVTNNAPRTIIDSTGSQVVVRCDGVATLPECATYNAQGNQVSPPGSVVKDPATANLTVKVDQLPRFKAAALSNGTYFTSCPSESELTGAIVYVDVPMTTTCSISGNAQINSAASPGFLVMPKGELSLKGASTYYGVIYMGNCMPEGCTPSSDVVVDIGGNATVIGGVIIDGPGALDVGANGSAGRNTPNIQYSANAFAKISTYGTAGLVQNTWQELPSG